MYSNKINSEVLCEKVIFRNTVLHLFFFSHSLIVTITILVLFYFDPRGRMCLELFLFSRNLL